MLGMTTMIHDCSYGDPMRSHSAYLPIITAVSDLFEAKSELPYAQAAALVKTCQDYCM